MSAYSTIPGRAVGIYTAALAKSTLLTTFCRLLRTLPTVNA